MNITPALPSDCTNITPGKAGRPPPMPRVAWNSPHTPLSCLYLRGLPLPPPPRPKCPGTSGTCTAASPGSMDPNLAQVPEERAPPAAPEGAQHPGCPGLRGRAAWQTYKWLKGGDNSFCSSPKPPNILVSVFIPVKIEAWLACE